MFFMEEYVEGMCSVRWAGDGSELHAEMCDGEVCGYGRFIFSGADGSEFRGIFRAGLPQDGFLLTAGKVRRLVACHKLFPGRPIWDIPANEMAEAVEASLAQQLQHAAQDVREAPLPPFIFARAWQAPYRASRCGESNSFTRAEMGASLRRAKVIAARSRTIGDQLPRQSKRVSASSLS